MAINVAGLQINTELVGAGIVIGGLYKIQQATVSAGMSAFEAYKSYELLSKSMESLVAREKIKADNTLQMKDALAMSNVEAQKLLNWTQRLAILSPFSQDGINQAFKMVQSYGFVTDSLDKTVVSTKRLTQAMLDYVAGTGQGQEVMSRIALALGQIRAIGALQGDEMNQLQETGLNVRKILSEAFDVSVSEMMKMKDKGLITADKAILAIVEDMEKTTGGMAANASDTFAGLMESVSDMTQVAQRKIFGPFFDAMKQDYQTFADMIGDPGVMRNIEVLGSKVGEYATTAFAVLRNAINPVMSVKAALSSVGDLVLSITGGVAFLGESLARLVDPAASLANLAGFVDRPEVTGNALGAALVGTVGAMGVNKLQGIGSSFIEKTTPSFVNADSSAFQNAMNYRSVGDHANAMKSMASATRGARLEIIKYRAETAVLQTSLSVGIGTIIAIAAIQWAEYNKQIKQATESMLEHSQIMRNFTALDEKIATAGMDEQEKRVYRIQRDYDMAKTEFEKAQAHLGEVIKDQAFNMGGGWQGVVADIVLMFNVGIQKILVYSADFVFDNILNPGREFILGILEDATRSVEFMSSNLGEGLGEIWNETFGKMFGEADIPLLRQKFQIDTSGVDQFIDSFLREEFVLNPDVTFAISPEGIAQQRQNIMNLFGFLGDPVQEATDAIASARDEANAALAEMSLAGNELIKLREEASSREKVPDLTSPQQAEYTKLLEAGKEYYGGLEEQKKEYEAELADIDHQAWERNLEARKAYNNKLLDIDAQYNQSLINYARQARNETQSAFGDTIADDVSFYLGAEDRLSAHNKNLETLMKQGGICKVREAKEAFEDQEAAEAEAYARQAAVREDAIGKALIDYTIFQGTVKGLGSEAINAMTAQIRDQFGVAESSSERASRQAMVVIDEIIDSGGQGISMLGSRLGNIRRESVQTQIEIDNRVKQSSDALTKQFTQGEITKEQYIASLRDVNRNVLSDMGLLSDAEVVSQKLVDLEQDTQQQRLDAQKQFNESVRMTNEDWVDEQKKIAKEGYEAFQQEALTTYAATVVAAEEALNKLTPIQREETNRRLLAQIQAQVGADQEKTAAIANLWETGGATMEPWEIMTEAGKIGLTHYETVDNAPKFNKPREARYDDGVFIPADADWKPPVGVAVDYIDLVDEHLQKGLDSMRKHYLNGKTLEADYLRYRKWAINEDAKRNPGEYSCADKNMSVAQCLLNNEEIRRKKDQVTHRAGGGPVFPGTRYLVGERGMEMVEFDAPGSVIPNSQMWRSPGIQIALSNTYHVHVSGDVSDETIKKLKREIIDESTNTMMRTLDKELSQLQREGGVLTI